MDSSGVDHGATSNPAAEKAEPVAKDSASTGDNSSTNTFLRFFRKSFNSPVRKLIWGVLTVIGVVLGIVVPVSGFFDHPSQLSLEAGWLSVSNSEYLQTPFQLSASRVSAESPSSKVQWLALYSITNSGTQVISLKDVFLDLPVENGGSGEKVQLRRTGDSPTMTVYAGYTDFEAVHNIKSSLQRSDEEFMRTFNRPILLEAGQTYYIEYQQQFQLEVNGKPYPFTSAAAMAYIFGQYFHLTRNANGAFECGSVSIPTSIETANGILHKQVVYLISFPGCAVNV